MADAIEAELGHKAALVSGKRGEFTVRVDDRIVAQKDYEDFPSEDTCVTAVRDALR